MPPDSSFQIAVVDDDAAIRRLVRLFLKRSGYDVVCSDSGIDGLRRLESGEFMGVVSDMRTPGGETLPATGKSVTWDSADVIRLSDDKVASWHVYFDQQRTGCHVDGFGCAHQLSLKLLPRKLSQTEICCHTDF